MTSSSAMLRVFLAALLGVLLSIGTALALVSSQAPEDIDTGAGVLSSYGER